MIPKIIHYCWFNGSKYPELIESCISSWKKRLPDYEFILWDAERIKSCSNLWLEQALEKRKYAFGADYVRFYALYHYGGIYLDTDVEVIKSFNTLLDQPQFVGEEYTGDAESAVLGAEKGLSWVKECLDHYENRPFIMENGALDTRPVPLLISEVLKNYDDIRTYKYEYFSPKNFYSGKVKITSKTYCIHHFDSSWVNKGAMFKLKKKLHAMLCVLLGRSLHNSLVSFIRKF